MVQFDTRIPMMIQQPNLLAAMDAGTTNAANQAGLMRQAEGQNVFRQYGAGAMQGDQNALAQIAGFDPILGQELQAGRLDMDATRQGMSFAAEEMQMLRDETARALATAQDQAAAAQEAAQVDALATAAIRAHAAGDKVSFSKLTAELFNGQPLPFNDNGLGALAAVHDGAKTYVSSIPKAPEAEAPRTLIGKINADLKAGLITPEDAKMELERAKPRGMTVQSDGQGGFIFSEGPGVGAAGGDTNIGDVYNPAEVTSTLGLIGEIFTDPNLARITGPIQGGGGNDPEALTMMQRIMAGEAGLGTIAKINQVQSRGWLAARQMLKGGGPITDYESRKAEAAVARLTRAQGEVEFKAALTDFHDAIREGMVKLQKAGKLPPGTQIPSPLGGSAPAQAAVAPGQGVDLSNATMEDLLQMDLSTAPLDQMDAWERRFNELKGQR